MNQLIILVIKSGPLMLLLVKHKVVLPHLKVGYPVMVGTLPPSLKNWPPRVMVKVSQRRGISHNDNEKIKFVSTTAKATTIASAGKKDTIAAKNINGNERRHYQVIYLNSLGKTTKSKIRDLKDLKGGCYRPT